MDELSRRLDPIEIVAYDPTWRAAFERERERMTPVLRPLRRALEHIGSTAVPGLPAKAIIDMLAIVGDIDAASEAIEPLERIGWCHAPEPLDELDRQLSFCYPSVGWRTHHLHVVEERSPSWRDWLAFRDYLRGHPEVARDYATLKMRLARECGHDPNDRAGYRAGKADFIVRVTHLARTTE